ncbi:MAG TPA: hypothetical protein VLQ20_10195 [Planococcus sp. (in: firmicutes)]|nr:hypothetical protein [Planococcus sp. (in: firmicutes)]
MGDGKKKILILGGTRHMIDVVKTANAMGFYTIVADNVEGSPAKAHADKFFDESTADIQKLAEIVRVEKVDGVFTAFEDINTWNAEKLARVTGLSFYATEEQLEISSNKNKFKEFCRLYAVPVIPEYTAEGTLGEELLQNMKFPVIAKPVDSYASKGITVCHNPAEMRAGFEKALSFSKSGMVIVEPFIDNSYGVQMFYAVREGEIVLNGTADRFVHKQSKEHPPLPIAMTFPSKHQQQFIDTVDPNVRSLILGMGIENGLVFIQSLYAEGAFYIYEMGFRFSGEQHYKIIEKQTGINLLEMMLEFAVGEDIGKYGITAFDHGYMPKPSCNLPILLDAGTIANVSGMDKINRMEEVVSYCLNHEVGDAIAANGSYTQMFGRFNLVAGSEEELHNAMETLYDTLKIESLDGADMVLAKHVPARTSGQ